MGSPLYTVIGDLVGSRRSPDRARLQDRLGEALREVSARVPVAQPFEPTVGDEYQGACATLSEALTAALLVRLSLLPLVDTRCGVGCGEVAVHDASRTPLLQDGPGWWSAREAIETIGGPRDDRRTWFVGEGSATINAFLVCRDQVLSRLNERGVRMLRLALLGHSQKQIAEQEGVWPSAVSQQFRRGIGAVLQAHALVAAAGPPHGRP
jgi:DNA-binding CsgD family transcriptional regulator